MTSPAQWETIRPWIDRLAIQVKELTSISATFILTSAIHHVKFDDEMASSLLNDVDPLFKADRAFKSVGEVLDRGFTVKVNEARWNNYFLNVDEHEDEAVIILYGLRPGRMYEVELTVEQDESVRKDFVTLKDELETLSPLNDDLADVAEHTIDSEPASPEIASSKDLTPPVTPASSSPPLHTPLTTEERTAHLQGTRTSISQEHDSLISQLKMARKESQRAENATKAEIEALKRAAEKQGLNDQRSKQKILALQEAVKQTLSATIDLEAQAKELEETLPALKDEEKVVEDEHSNIREVTREKEAEVDMAVRADKKRISDLQSELSTLNNKVEKLTLRKDKLAEGIPDLEKQIGDMKKEREEAEAEKERFERMLNEDPLAALRARGLPIPIMRQGNLNVNPNGQWNGPPISGPFAPSSGTGAGSFSNINAAAPPFYPRQQPSLLHNRSTQGPIVPRVVGDFRPFDSVIPQVPLMHLPPLQQVPSHQSQSQQSLPPSQGQGPMAGGGAGGGDERSRFSFGNFGPRLNRSSGGSQ